jgi:uncharacterized integral membrane protein (TIGR00698 family)
MSYYINIKSRTVGVFPGLLVSIIIGLAASFLSDHYSAPAMLFALLLGMSLNFIADDQRTIPGIAFSGRTLLRVGVALLGFRIVLGDILALGVKPIFLLFLAVLTTLMFGFIMARLTGLSKHFGALSGGAVGICGASAALAIAAILPKSEKQERETAFAVVAVTALSTMAMIIYPLISAALEFSDVQAGVFIGATVHDVAQVVGAGYSISDEAGDMATLFKLIRVALLLPVVIILSLLFRGDAEVGAERPPLLPGFLTAFVIITLVNSFIEIPAAVTDTMSNVSRQCLITAIAAIGLKTDMKSFLELGRMPVIILVAETIWLAAFVIVCMLLLR